LQLDVTLLDRSFTHLDGAAANAASGGVPAAVIGDALSLPFGDAAFDVVSCGLFAHHLEPAQLLMFVDEALRVCRVAVLINDLIRHPLHLAVVYAGLPLYRSRLTRHDAPASVRRSYTTGEMLRLLQGTQATSIDLQQHYLFRMAVIAWK
jgi:ubiquinone/menaquinone biosynthesis C-methylase UbiE